MFHCISLNFVYTRPLPRYKVTILSDKDSHNELTKADAGCNVKTDIPQNNGKE
jgi:hypothetical protein